MQSTANDECAKDGKYENPVAQEQRGMSKWQGYAAPAAFALELPMPTNELLLLLLLLPKAQKQAPSGQVTFRGKEQK
jgi:hypothetical protein